MKFYVNKNEQWTGEHEVHRADCAWLPDVANRIYLGEFYTSQAAVQEARKYYNCVDGCAHCCLNVTPDNMIRWPAHLWADRFSLEAKR